tara:strand:+ start:3606 stop:3860 length:255 start_codon:yes stop_codon:yes gene_type:complete
MRGINKSFFHYYVNEAQEDGTYSEPVFFRTLMEMKERYGISRANVYRLINQPDAPTKFPHKITKQFVHQSAIPFINNNQDELYA